MMEEPAIAARVGDESVENWKGRAYGAGDLVQFCLRCVRKVQGKYQGKGCQPWL
jgi:hypothetical protein